MEVAALADAFGSLTGPAVLALLLVLVLRGDLVTRRSHEAVLDRCSEELAKVEKDRARWEQLGLEALTAAEVAVQGRPQ